MRTMKMKLRISKLQIKQPIYPPCSTCVHSVNFDGIRYCRLMYSRKENELVSCTVARTNSNMCSIFGTYHTTKYK